jgi:vacuolar-type H+-ATPase subunit C/Vma6
MIVFIVIDYTNIKIILKKKIIDIKKREKKMILQKKGEFIFEFE